MVSTHQLVEFSLDSQHYGLPLSEVECVIQSVAITPMPKGPGVVLGIVDFHGTVIPVINLRRRFGCRDRQIALEDHFILTHTPTRLVFLAVDRVTQVAEVSEEDIVAKERISPNIELIKGVVKTSQGLVLIHDLDSLLSLQEETCLEEALGEDE